MANSCIAKRKYRPVKSSQASQTSQYHRLANAHTLRSPVANELKRTDGNSCDFFTAEPLTRSLPIVPAATFRPHALTSRTVPLRRFRFAPREYRSDGFTARTHVLHQIDQKSPARWLDRPGWSSTASPSADEANGKPNCPPTQPRPTSSVTTAAAGAITVAAIARAFASSK